MTQIATVDKILNDTYAVISVPRKAACGHDCEECAGCGVSGSAVQAKAKNLVGARPGQKVVVESDTKNMLGIIALVYFTPVLLFLLGYLLTVSLSSVALRYGIAVAGFVAGIIPALLYDRKLRRQGGLEFTIVRLF